MAAAHSPHAHALRPPRIPMRSWQHHRAGGGRVTTPVERVQRVRQDRHTGVTARVVDGKNGSFFVKDFWDSRYRMETRCHCTAMEDGTKGFVLQWKTVQNPG